MPDNTDATENSSNTEATRVADDTNTTTDANRGEIIEVEWENVKHIFEFRQKLQDMETYFANMCLQFEKNKSNMMTQINYGQNDLYMMAEQLQKTQNIDGSLTYELKLPANPGDKAYFLRKEEQTGLTLWLDSNYCNQQNWRTQ